MILMPTVSKQPVTIIGNANSFEEYAGVPALSIFNSIVYDFLDRLSKKLLKNPSAKLYPDVATFAFWCRKASILKIAEPYNTSVNRIGRGVAFHIAPSNVPVNFAYTLVTGLLAGNSNIVRLPSKEFEQVDIIVSAINGCLNDEVAPYICLIRYGHEVEITNYLSALCDTRVIWGGDTTIKTIRQSPLKARAYDVTFADRFSFCVIDADEYLRASDKERLALDFYNDSLLTDQNACTSPKLVIWLGDAVTQARTEFWQHFVKLAKSKYDLKPVQAVSKYSNFCRSAANGHGGVYWEGGENIVSRILLASLSTDTQVMMGNSGYFMEYVAKDLRAILPICNSSAQTLSYFGIPRENLRDLIIQAGSRGIDRIVPIGKTMDFSVVWDGMDLINNLSKEVSFY